MIVYIDGFNLYYGLREKYRRRFLWLDLHALGASLIKPNQQLVAVKYFTAPVRDDPATLSRQQALWSALRARGGVEIIPGRFQRKAIECRTCGSSWYSFEEKETDVAVAVALVEDAALGRYDTAIIVSADSDLCPAVRSVRRVRPNARIVVAFPPARRSDDLRSEADAAFTLGRSTLQSALLPEVVTTPVGVGIRRPAPWH